MISYGNCQERWVINHKIIMLGGSPPPILLRKGDDILIYQPSFPSPHMNAIDVTQDNIFRFCVNGNYVDKYQITIYDVSTNKQVYTTGQIVLDERVYGNNGDESFIDVNIPANCGMYNGQDYKWVVKMWQAGVYDIPVVYGRVYQENTSTSTIQISPHKQDSVFGGMNIKIGNIQYPIKSYYPQYPKCSVIKSSSPDYTEYKAYSYIYLSSDEVSYFKQGDLVRIYNTSKNRGGYIEHTVNFSGYDSGIKEYAVEIVVHDPDRKYTGFHTYSEDDQYGPTTIEHVHNQSLYGNVSTTGLPLNIQEGTPYTIMYDAIENDLEFYFKARDNGVTTVYANGARVVGDIELSSSVLKLEAEYTQAQNVSIKYWQVDIQLNGGTVATSGMVLNSLIRYEYDALLNNNTYDVKLTIVNDDDSITEHRFNVTTKYPQSIAFAKPEVEYDCNPHVRVSWENAHTIYGKGDFEVNDDSFENEMLILKKGQSVLWDTIDDTNPLEFPSDYNNASCVEIMLTDVENFHHKFMDVFGNTGDMIEVGYDGLEFWWNRNSGRRYTFNPYSDVAVGVFPTEEQIQQIQNDEICCYWSTSEDDYWSNDQTKYFYTYDVCKEFWWLVKINLCETNDQKLVTFTRYNKE